MKNFTDDLYEDLKNPEFALEYLNAASEDEDSQVFLLALNDFVKANGGFTDTAKSAGVTRANLHRALSSNGNPRYGNLVNILKSLGLKLKIDHA